MGFLFSDLETVLLQYTLGENNSLADGIKCTTQPTAEAFYSQATTSTADRSSKASCGCR